MTVRPVSAASPQGGPAASDRGRMRTLLRRRPWLAWSIAALGPAALVLLTGMGPASRITWGTPTTLFRSVPLAAVPAIALALFVMAQGWLRNRAEVALLGAALAGLSAMLLVHGLTAPGLLYGTNTAVSVSVFAGVPLALLTCLAIVFPTTNVGIVVGRAWRAWSIALVALAFAFAAFLLIAPNAIPAPPGPHSLFTITVVALSIAAAIRISLRHVRLFEVGHRVGSMVGAVSMAQLGTVMLVFVLPTAFSPGWWLAHVFGFVAIYAGCFGLISAYRAEPAVDIVTEPVLAHDPLIALELGLSPEIRSFVDALGEKDALTQEHVIRVSDLAIRVGRRAGLSPAELRTLGLGALLHDIGKLVMPDEILQKPAGLTDDEYAIVRSHPVDGAEILSDASQALQPVAPLVRWHHERFDGTGYPDQLAGPALPLPAQIISVCDAWDAMTALRVYRDAMPIEKARAIMNDGAGKQWNAACVELLLEETAATPAAEAQPHGHVHNASSLDDLAECCA